MCVFSNNRQRQPVANATGNASMFVQKESIVRRIWGRSDTVLFIFAGAAAEFSLNKAVDWLYFTGRLPIDPLGRLFSTVAYARSIIFSENDEALAAIDNITAIHKHVEQQRGAAIPQWAYRDVLYMLIDYSVRAHELLYHKLTAAQKEEVYNVFYRVGSRMGIERLAVCYDEWLLHRAAHIKQHLTHSRYTIHLFDSYRTHLGVVRYAVMLQAQAALLPAEVRQMLGLKAYPVFMPLLAAYKHTRAIKLSGIMKAMLLPANYKQQILQLDIT